MEDALVTQNNATDDQDGNDAENGAMTEKEEDLKGTHSTAGDDHNMHLNPTQIVCVNTFVHSFDPSLCITELMELQRKYRMMMGDRKSFDKHAKSKLRQQT